MRRPEVRRSNSSAARSWLVADERASFRPLRRGWPSRRKLWSIILLVVLAALAVRARLDQVSRKRDETAQTLPGPGSQLV